MKRVNVAVVGATGAVGRTMLSILAERGFPVKRMRLMASPRSAGEVVPTSWGDIEVEDLEQADPSGIDLALFSAGGERSFSHAPRFTADGAVVVDNSSAFRMEDNVPLVVSGVNDEAAQAHEGIIANPNCTTMTLMMAVGPLHRAAGLESLAVSSYQSVSGSGQRGIDELSRQLDVLGEKEELLVRGGWSEPGGDLFPRPIGYNVVPFAGNSAMAGHTDEEWKLVHETRKILDSDSIRVEPTCVRVPVFVGHGMAASMFFHRALDVDEATGLLSRSPGLQLWSEVVPTPLDSAGIDDVLVGRVRPTVGTEGGISLWAVGDNLRKGAALNAVQIAELVLS